MKFNEKKKERKTLTDEERNFMKQFSNRYGRR